MRRIIYSPRGRAQEYVETGRGRGDGLAANLYEGCPHGCLYCYAPGCLRQDRQAYHRHHRPRPDVLRDLALNARALRGDPRLLLLCFTCDPYPAESATTRAALEVLEANAIAVTVLTKGGLRAVRDFDILARNGWAFGTSLVFIDAAKLARWEPNAPSTLSRLAAMGEAKQQGLRVWVSLEPVIDTAEALRVIETGTGTVDHWKIGKLNHGAGTHPELGRIERATDWGAFLEAAEERLTGQSYYIKEDLLRAAGREVPAPAAEDKPETRNTQEQGALDL